MSYKELATTIARLSDKLDIAKDFIAELKSESVQWQESCGQNYVRATEAEMREEEKDRRIAKLEAALRRIRDEGRKDTTWFARFIVDESGKALEQSK